MLSKHEYLRKFLAGEAVEPHEKWAKWATTHEPLLSPSILSLSGRRINNFCVGSDPEFAFMYPPNGERVNAYEAGLRVGLVAGCDQNERLVELRPWPSQSVVTHVAGILVALRWMYQVYGTTASVYWWRAGAFFDGDGMGGHVHFGRKRPTRPEEVAALDGLAKAFRGSLLFDGREWDARIRGDRLGQRYGSFGDFRVQAHGYEYRTLPSWLASPKVAFICLTASKLAVLDPPITVNWKITSPEECRNKLRGLAKLYKGRDDDAYIMYHLLTQQRDDIFQVPWRQDFSIAWGFPPHDLRKATKTFAGTILPDAIEPTTEDITEILNHLVIGATLENKTPNHKFVASVPEGYVWVPSVVHPARRSGFGDLIHNLVHNKFYPISWAHTNERRLEIVGYLPDIWKREDTKIICDFYKNSRIVSDISRGNDTIISVPKELCQHDTLKELVNLLTLSGLFPIWTVDSVESDSVVNWAANFKRSDKSNWRKL